MMEGFLPLFPLLALAAEPVSEMKIDERLPKLSGEFLTGQEAVLPEVASGRVTLLLLRYLILLDCTSKVAWLYRGTVDDTAFGTLCTQLSELVTAQ